MSKEEKQSDRAVRRGISASVVQKQKKFVRPEKDEIKSIGVETEKDEIKPAEVKLKETAARSIVVESKDEETSADSYFETLRLDVDHYAPKNESMRVIVRDVAEVKPEIENIVTVLPEVKASESATEIVVNDTKTEAAEPVRVVARTPKTRKTTAKKLSATDLKEREISKAIRNASKLPENKKSRAKKGLGFGWVRTALVVSCIATGFFAIAYFVNLSANDMSLKVAAIQSGIEAVYPSYIPREFALSDVTASNGKILMNFKSSEGSAYSISEENTTWDSTALLNNYIKEEYGEDYTVVKEQGLTLYMGEGWEAWVNGGLLYKLKVNSGSLTKKQLKAIATSL